MAKFYRTLRRPFETAAFRVALAVIPRLPRRVILALAWAGGNLGFLFDRSGRQIGLANLDIAFGLSKSPEEKRTILRHSFITFTRTLLDVIWFGTKSKERLNRYVKPDDSVQRLFCGKNQICVTAHFGNWEVAGQNMALHDFPFYSIAMPVKNPAVDRLLIERREVTGQKIIPREGALRKMLGVLRGGGKVAFLVDQNTEEHEGGIWVDFFGLPVPVTPAPAALAVKTGSEIFIGFCEPLCGGHYRFYITEIIVPPKTASEETTRALTQQIMSAIERQVGNYPEHWLWMYKRWKIKNRSVNPERYPFYADKD
ncbi:MAG: lysophospholipid acyltransferase family protein [Kiritimatiellaceae bacterium]|nr:lysophospholipid acyltransferase family protein [Kiritimatiellaceae bacterium]